MAFSRNIILIIICFFLTNLHCNNKSYSTDTSAPLLGQPKIEDVTTAYNDTALFLAGLPLNKAEFKHLTETKSYEEYKTAIDTNWNNFFGSNRTLIADWTKKHLGNNYSRALFYPFSGPDILHALTFYPEANEIIMFGLEPTGGIPDITQVDKANIQKSLRQLLTALNFSLGKAFFVTQEMQEQVTPSSLNGISAIMLFFLARGEYYIIQVNNININPDGSIENGFARADRGSVNGVEILFAEKNSYKIKRARYFTLDIENKSPQMERFTRYIANYPPFTTIIKSASYLVWWDNFSTIRNLILERSESILQDDTGIPYKILKDNEFWEVTHFGKYHRPIPIFKACYQKDLEEDNLKFSKADIPFVYGYGYGYKDITYQLIKAQKVYPGQNIKK